MNCFIIMPFSESFDDVYVSIKRSVEDVIGPLGGSCFRLDERRPAGRITPRLVAELKSARLCIADLTGSRPNVMWEVGYAMALGCPTILLTQNIEDIPFDLGDMQSLKYDRDRLSGTIGSELGKIVNDTILMEKKLSSEESQNELVGTLINEISEMKKLVSQLVGYWDSGTDINKNRSPMDDIRHLEGAWFNDESNSNFYMKIVNDELVVPYCFGGDDELVGVYYDFRKIGSYWFGRYRWLDSAVNIAGFAFLKQKSPNELSGAWWDNEDSRYLPDLPPDKFGVSATWRRLSKKKFPPWAAEFIGQVSLVGLDGAVSEYNKKK